MVGACPNDVVLVHRATNTHLVERAAPPRVHMSAQVSVVPVGTHGPAVSVIAVPPAVAAAGVVQRAMSVAASVPEDALGLAHREPEVAMPVVRRV